MSDSGPPLGFTPALPLLGIGLGAFGLAMFATVFMVLKYVIFGKRHQQPSNIQE